MSMRKPNFFDSPYFVMDVDNWHLMPGASDEIVCEFTEYMKGDVVLTRSMSA